VLLVGFERGQGVVDRRHLAGPVGGVAAQRREDLVEVLAPEARLRIVQTGVISRSIIAGGSSRDTA